MVTRRSLRRQGGSLKITAAGRLAHLARRLATQVSQIGVEGLRGLRRKPSEAPRVQAPRGQAPRVHLTVQLIVTGHPDAAHQVTTDAPGAIALQRP